MVRRGLLGPATAAFFLFITFTAAVAEHFDGDDGRCLGALFFFLCFFLLFFLRYFNHFLVFLFMF